jgi:hypothetical protein
MNEMLYNHVVEKEPYLPCEFPGFGIKLIPVFGKKHRHSCLAHRILAERLKMQPGDTTARSTYVSDGICQQLLQVPQYINDLMVCQCLNQLQNQDFPHKVISKDLQVILLAKWLRLTCVWGLHFASIPTKAVHGSPAAEKLMCKICITKCRS